jgi:hypothetical protein
MAEVWHNVSAISGICELAFGSAKGAVSPTQRAGSQLANRISVNAMFVRHNEWRNGSLQHSCAIPSGKRGERVSNTAIRRIMNFIQAAVPVCCRSTWVGPRFIAGFVPLPAR